MAVVNELKTTQKFHIIEDTMVNSGGLNDNDENLIITANPGDNDFLNDKLFYTAYAYDILNTNFESEENRIVIKGQNHQENVRNYLIEVIRWYSKFKKYSKSAIHLAVLILDIYMESYVLSSVREHQKFVALVILLLAVKTEENDENVPSIKELLNFVDLSEELGIDLKEKDKYEPQQISLAYKSYLKLYCTLEFMVFQSMRFNTIRPTVISFVTIFQKIAVVESDLKDIPQCEKYIIKSIDDLKYFVNQYLNVLSEIVLYDISFHNYLPSKVAAAMIGTTRKMLNINTIWNLQLEFLTQSTFQEIEPIINVFLGRLCSMDDICTDYSSDIEDSGFHSINKCPLDESFCSIDDSGDDGQEIMAASKKIKASL